MILPDSLPAPTLAAYLEQMPPELRRAIADYVQAEYLDDVGEPELAEGKRARFFATVREYTHDPHAKRTSTLRPTY